MSTIKPYAPGAPISFGIAAETGLPLDGIDAQTLHDFSGSDDPDAVLREYLEEKSNARPHLGVVGEIRDPNDPKKCGWAVMYASSADESIKEALAPLLKHREMQCAPNLFRTFEGDTSFQPGDTAETWLARRRIRMDAVRPSLGVPFYILIVGPPDEIPFEFQYELDLYWAVGRIWFSSPDEFRQYADSVVVYETMAPAGLPTARQIAVFAPCHYRDSATQAFSTQVAEPMVNGSFEIPRTGEAQDFALKPFIGPAATRTALEQIFNGRIENGTPALVFSGGHGMAVSPSDEENQISNQGAIVCQDWPGTGYPCPRDFYFGASDLDSNSRVHGIVHFLFACYGGGWPQFDTFSRVGGSPRMVANRPMLAKLPQALLAHPNGGALAVIAHVDRAWSCSFQEGGNAQTQAFSDVLARILWGDRIGLATDQFNMRWASLSIPLSDSLDRMRNGLAVDPDLLANQWVARDDARNYIVFGDPAVRLRVEDMPLI